MPSTKGTITAAQAKKLSDNWTNLRAKENETAAGKPDNRSSWYSLQDIKDYIALIEVNEPNVNGIRFYLGVETSKKDPKGLTTIFMVPTEDDCNGKSKDIQGATAMDKGEKGSFLAGGYPQ